MNAAYRGIHFERKDSFRLVPVTPVSAVASATTPAAAAIPTTTTAAAPTAATPTAESATAAA